MALENLPFGQRLIPTLVDQVAREDPTRTLFSCAIGDDLALGFNDISSASLANAVNKVAWLLERDFGKPEIGSFPSIGYIGPNDIRYFLLIVASVKVGYVVKMVLLSPRDSIEGHLAVIDGSQCRRWVRPTGAPLPALEMILGKREMQVASIPGYKQLLDDEPVAQYLYSRTFAQARQEPLMILHTSGSTGLPKAVTVPHGTMATIDAHHLLDPVDDRPVATRLYERPLRAYFPFPYFHAAGLATNFLYPLYFQIHAVLSPSSIPLTPDLANRILEHGKINTAIMPPSILEEMSRDERSLQNLSRLDFLVFGGGPLDQACGDVIDKVVPLISIVGSTKGAMLPIIMPVRGGWMYLHIHPAAGFTYRPHDEEMFEQFQTRQPELDLFQGSLQTFPELDEVATHDLFSKHPTRGDTWLYGGRADDVIVLSNGEKVHALDMEDCINSHPTVRSTLVVDQGRFQIAALVELRAAPEMNSGMRTAKDHIQDVIAMANRKAPAHGQLYPDFIVFTSGDKPFVRAGTGTVMRKATIDLYEPELAALYTTQEPSEPSDEFIIDLSSVERIQAGICELIGQILSTPGPSANADFFSLGLDSLATLRVVKALRSALAGSNSDLNALKSSTIYSNPSAAKLGAALYQLLHPSDSKRDISTTDNVEQMYELLNEYTLTMAHTARVKPDQKPPYGLTVILTGSTGSLGSYLLDQMLSDPSIGHIYCLNRSDAAHARQMQSDRDQGLKHDLSPDRVTFVRANLADAKLGLDDGQYNELLQSAIQIIHNAWPVNFNLALDSFEPHIAGVHNLATFALASRCQASITFLSTIGVTRGCDATNAVPQSPIIDLSVAKGGYSQSKLISECGLGGAWNKREWVPSLIASSKYLGLLPSDIGSLGRVDWIPVNLCSKIVLELSDLNNENSILTTESELMSHIFHVVNPQATTWTALVPTIAAEFRENVRVVSWEEWVKALEASEENAALDRNPALKLLPFFKGVGVDQQQQMPVLDTTQAQCCSATLRNMEPVEDIHVKEWMQQWKFV